MFEFFDMILGFIETLWSFVVSFFSSLFYAIDIVHRGIGTWALLIGYLPAVIGAAVTIFMVCYVVKFIVGR